MARKKMELGLATGRAIAEYVFLTGFNHTATLELMGGPIKKMLKKEGYTFTPSAETQWFDAKHDYPSWSQKFKKVGMSYLGTPITADQVKGFRRMQPLIVATKSKAADPAGLKGQHWVKTKAPFTKDDKKQMLVFIKMMAAGDKFEEDTTLTMLKDMENGDPAPADSLTPKTAITIPGSVPKLSYTRKLKKRAFPESKKLPAGAGPIIVTFKPLAKGPAGNLIPAPYRMKAKWQQPSLTLIFEAGQTVKYSLSNTQDLYEVVMDGKPVIFEGGNVQLAKFAPSPKTVEGFEAKLSQGSLNVSSEAGITEFFSPDLIKKDGFPFPLPDGLVAPLVGFPIPDLTTTVVSGTDLTFSMTEYINDVSDRKNWMPGNGYKAVVAGAANPVKWVAIYHQIDSIHWSPDGLTAQAEYLQPLPFNPKNAKVLDLKKEYITVAMEVDAATDIYTGYDWKSPTSSAGTLIFPGDERNLIPLVRKDPDKRGTELEIKGASRGNAIKEIRFHNGIAQITVDGGSFRIPDDSGDGTFYALDNTSVKIDGKLQELRCRVKDVVIENYGAKVTPDTTWTNMRAVRRYKNLAASILPGATDAVGKECPKCGMEDVVSPCPIEGCPMPLQSEVGVGSLGYYTDEASGTYLILLAPDDNDPGTTFEIRMTIKN